MRCWIRYIICLSRYIFDIFIVLALAQACREIGKVHSIQHLFLFEKLADKLEMLGAGRAYWALGIMHHFGRSNGFSSRLCLPLQLDSSKILILINNWVRGAQFAHLWDLELILGAVQEVIVIHFNPKLFMVL